MIRIKQEHLNLETLGKYGFFDNGQKDYALDPAVEKKDHPLAKLFTALNTFIKKENGQIWCGFKTDDVDRVIEELLNAGIAEVVQRPINNTETK